MEHLWATQDALKAALKAAAEVVSGDVSADLGFPKVIQRKHIWIEGNARGSNEYELSGGDPSGTKFTIGVNAIVTFAGEYEDAREELKKLDDIVKAAVDTLAPTTVSHYQLGDWDVREGRTSAPENHRQLAFGRDIECYIW